MADLFVGVCLCSVNWILKKTKDLYLVWTDFQLEGTDYFSLPTDGCARSLLQLSGQIYSIADN